jgi:hypothetical protein
MVSSSSPRTRDRCRYFPPMSEFGGGNNKRNRKGKGKAQEAIPQEPTQEEIAAAQQAFVEGLMAELKDKFGVVEEPGLTAGPSSSPVVEEKAEEKLTEEQEHLLNDTINTASTETATYKKVEVQELAQLVQMFRKDSEYYKLISRKNDVALNAIAEQNGILKKGLERAISFGMLAMWGLGLVTGGLLVKNFGAVKRACSNMRAKKAALAASSAPLIIQ